MLAAPWGEMMKRVLIGLVLLLTIPPAWAEEGGQLPPDWAPIPEGRGIEAFYGVWVDNSEQNRMACGDVTIGPDVIRYGIKRPNGCRDIPYRVVETTSHYVILAAENHLGDKPPYYDYMYFRANRNESSVWEGMIHELRRGSCGSTNTTSDPEAKRYYMGNRIFTMPLPELKALWEANSFCHPAYRKAGELPLHEGWSSWVLFRRNE